MRSPNIEGPQLHIQATAAAVSNTSCLLTRDTLPPTLTWRNWLGETAAILAIFAALGAGPPPAVNEAHYLTKARHFWDPSWCAGDAFLESADAHGVFFATFGWVTHVVSLPAAAWIGRVLAWGSLAIAWQRLSWCIVPRRWYAVISSGLLLAGVQRCHLAGEWLVGGIEAKCFAFTLVFLALERFQRNRWNIGWLCLGLATAFHVLVGGWSLLAGSMAWLGCGRYRPPLRSQLPGLLGAAGLASVGLVPALLLNAGVTPQIARDANAIYVYERLSHHLIFHRFIYDHWIPLFPLARHLFVVAVWVIACSLTPCVLGPARLGQRPLRGFVGGAIFLAICGAILDQSLLFASDLAAAVLRYYWFRLSDIMVPLGASLAILGAVAAWHERRPALSRGIIGILTICVILNSVANLSNRIRDWQRGTTLESLGGAEFGLAEHPLLYEDWRRACDWIAANTEPHAKFLTPRWQQTFKWYAQRSEVVSWKDVPQDARSLVEWWERLGEACPPIVSAGGIAALTDDRILELATKYRFQYLVVDRWLGERPLPFRRVFPSENADGFNARLANYEVYALPAAEDPPGEESHR